MENQLLPLDVELESLVKLSDHYKAMEDFWADRWGSESSEARKYTDLRQGIDARIIDLMIAENNHA